MHALHCSPQRLGKGKRQYERHRDARDSPAAAANTKGLIVFDALGNG